MSKMPCHISDGPQTPEDAADLWNSREEDPDEAYDRMRQDRLDDERNPPSFMQSNETPSEICSIHGCEMDGERCEQCERDISEVMTELDPTFRDGIDNAVCVICKVAWVDVINGEDTCRGCLSRA